MPIIRNLQLGKQGITDNFIENLQHSFKKSGNIKVSVLKSARPEGSEGKNKVKEYAKEISEKLGNNYNIRTIGFTICIKKLRSG